VISVCKNLPVTQTHSKEPSQLTQSAAYAILRLSLTGVTNKSA
jgi:hypothetical protein